MPSEKSMGKYNNSSNASDISSSKIHNSKQNKDIKRSKTFIPINIEFNKSLNTKKRSLEMNIAYKELLK